MNPAHHNPGQAAQSNHGNTPHGTSIPPAPAHPFGFAPVPRNEKVHKTMPFHSVKDAELKRIITLLLNPPNQPPNPPTPVVVVHMDWARRIVGNQHFEKKPQESLDERKRFYRHGLKKKQHGKKGNPKNALWYKGLDFGLPYFYHMALCGEKKEKEEGDQLTMLKNEWEDGAENREKWGIQALKLE
jgi:hypothetical protein